MDKFDKVKAAYEAGWAAGKEEGWKQGYAAIVVAKKDEVDRADCGDDVNLAYVEYDGPHLWRELSKGAITCTFRQYRKSGKVARNEYHFSDDKGNRYFCSRVEYERLFDNRHTDEVFATIKSRLEANA